MKPLSALRLSLVSTLAAIALPLVAQTTSSAVITSCVSKLSGVSRIVAAPTACNAAVENVVMWNQQGPAGAPGIPGTPGATGSAGPTGPVGPQGAPGLTYRGAFNVDTFPYNKNDVVTYGGSTYIALTTAGGFPPSSFLNQASHEWGLLVPQGATGAQGIQGVAGPIGPQGVAGPTGPQGPAAQAPVVTVDWLYATESLDLGSSKDYYISCPAGSFVIGAACGARDANNDESFITVDYAGPSNQNGQLDNNKAPYQARCTMSNAFSPSTAVAYAVGCLSASAPSLTYLPAASTFRSCSYNPDTQPPCTEAEAIVTDPHAAAPSARTALDQTASAARAASGPVPITKHTRKVTLWFKN